MLSTQIKGGSGLSTSYVIRSTKNSKGGQTESKGGGQKHLLAPPEINPEGRAATIYMFGGSIGGADVDDPLYWCIFVLQLELYGLLSP